MKDYHDLPREELLQRAQAMLKEFEREGIKAELHFKFTCEKCGERCTLQTANTLYERGECCKCGHDQPIDKGGFSLQMIFGL